MNNQTMLLFHQGVRLGALARYGYATPWASAWLSPDDPATLARYSALCAFFLWNETLPDDLPAAQADARYAQELAVRGLAEAQVDAWWSDWQIQLDDGTIHEISLSQFADDGFVTWRW